MDPNTSVSSVNAIIVMQIEYSSHFVKARQRCEVVVYLMQNLHLRGRPHQSFSHGELGQ